MFVSMRWRRISEGTIVDFLYLTKKESQLYPVLPKQRIFLKLYKAFTVVAHFTAEHLKEYFVTLNVRRATNYLRLNYFLGYLVITGLQYKEGG